MRSSVPSSALWQRPIENTATAFAVDDGKVFMADEKGNLLCFDSQNGESVWNSSIYFGTSDYYSPFGAWHAGGIVVLGNQVYVAIENARISCFDKDNGTFLWTFRNADFFESVPRVIVKDGIIFALTNAISAHDAITGALLWEANPILENCHESNVFPLGGDSVDGKFVYATGGDFSRLHFYKIDAENGNVIWCSRATWDGTVLTWGAGNIYVPRVVASAQGKIIVEVIFQGGSWASRFFCLDSASGEELWSIDVGADEGYNPFVYGPIVYNDLFLFAKADGYLYAVNLADGTVAWKTKVDTQNLFSFNSSFNNTVQATSIQIDARNQRLFWGLSVAESGPSNNYTGTLCSLNLSDGNVEWIKQLESENATFGSFRFGTVLAFNDETNKVFLTKNNGLWIFDASTGDLVQSQQFDHYVFPPIVLGNETFVAADLWLFAYA
jgi:outer membrane protein assembly factor BamB